MNEFNSFSDLLKNMTGNLKPGEKPTWYQQAAYTEIKSFDVTKLIDLAKNTLFAQAMMLGGTVYEATMFITIIDLNVFKEFLKEQKAKLTYVNYTYLNNQNSWFYVLDFGAIYLEKLCNRDTEYDIEYEIQFVCNSEKEYTNLFNELKKIEYKV